VVTGGSLDAVVVTGAGRGIGKAVALSLGRSVVPVLCVSRTVNAEATRDAIRDAGGVADALVVDLADISATEIAVRAWIDSRPYARLGVVLAAGILGPAGPLRTTNLGDWASAFSVNVLGGLAVVRALLDRMTMAGRGRIVFLAGGGAAYAYPLFPAYACTKAAVVRAAENLHEDLKSKGDFAVVCLAPGAIDTDMLAAVRAAGAEVRTTVAVTDAVAAIVAFLGSASTALSGRFVHVRDAWDAVLEGTVDLTPDHWKLRRVE
jgi:NAD(P)-dependent dehydrogenase (short-subunit alcohol dehydrogenase family)